MKQFHEVASIFPMLGEQELQALADDIQEHGLREPIWLYEDKIVDGRNRYRACALAGIDPTYREWDSKGSLVAFVVSLNLKRRHLDESQRAMVAARIADLPKGANQHAQICAPSQPQAAEQLQVSRRSTQHARQVIEKGAPELASAVEQGKVKVSAAAEIASEPVEAQREIIARGEKEIVKAAQEIRKRKTEARRQERMERLAEISLGNGELRADRLYPIVYADPPWKYQHAESESRAIENQYPTMELDDICAMDLGAITTDDAVLFLWATSPKLEEAMRVVNEWGFRYKTCLVWDKDRVGMGYYARQQHELLLVATKGTPPAPAPSARPPSVIRESRPERHSSKPESFARLIEAMYPGLSRIELFCRSPLAGWDAWGNQA